MALLLPTFRIGESVGSRVAFRLAKYCAPRAVRQQAPLLQDFQRELERDGVPLRDTRVAVAVCVGVGDDTER